MISKFDLIQSDILTAIQQSQDAKEVSPQLLSIIEKVMSWGCQITGEPDPEMKSFIIDSAGKHLLKYYMVNITPAPLFKYIGEWISPSRIVNYCINQGYADYGMHRTVIGLLLEDSLRRSL